ncbi:MFS transporter [uncultured Sphaerochaeta sp.]|uniref:MFS transporter n=1 Tax=uncultured Sphaerochaeta sp. TaxID=886478 RepID=UPI002A0A2349|nr:MFS transporter [uncultured Sphaerochaeta sp.]
MSSSVTKPRFPRNAGFALYKGLGKNIYILFAVRVINRFGDFVQLLLVLILTGKLGMSNQMTGFYITLVLICTSFGQLAGGSVADRLPRKRVLAFCQGMVSLCYLVCALLIEGSHSNLVPPLILVCSPFRGATAPVSNTMVADFSSDSDRGRAFSLLYLGTNIGVAIGPLAAAFLYAHSLPLLFGGSALLIALSTIMLLCFIPLIGLETLQREEIGKKTHFFRELSKTPAVVWYLACLVLYCFTYGQTTFALPLQFSSLFGINKGAVNYGYLMTVNAVTVLVMTPLLTQLTIKRHQLKNIRLAMCFYTIGFGMYAFCTGYPFFLIATFVWTLGEILVATNGNVFLNAYAPVRYRARFNAVSIAAGGLGNALAPSLGALLLGKGNYFLLWSVMSAICFFLVFCYFKMYRRFGA